MSSPDKALKDDSAKGTDPEKGGKYGSGTSTGSSARGSAEFLSDVEGKRAIKVCLTTQISSIFGHTPGLQPVARGAHEGV